MIANLREPTTAALSIQQRYRKKATLHVAITGSSGLLGGQLVPFLTAGGHQVTRLVRREPEEKNELPWRPGEGRFDATPLEGVDGVIHLAGENIAAGRWTEERKRRLRDSRVQGTRLLCDKLAELHEKPAVLLSASAIGFYGNRGREELTESSPAGTGFLADVAQQWEQATRPAVEAGIRVVNVRFGMVLSPGGGPLASMLTPFKFGVGGRVGSGRQWWSWIGVDDAVGAVHHCLMDDTLSGPVNIVTPNPVTNSLFTRILARVIGRPAMLPLPAFAARLLLGQMADELLLASTRVYPSKLLATAYPFRHTMLEETLSCLMGNLKGIVLEGQGDLRSAHVARSETGQNQLC